MRKMSVLPKADSSHPLCKTETPTPLNDLNLTLRIQKEEEKDSISAGQSLVLGKRV